MLDDAELVQAYEQSLELTRQLGRVLRARRQRVRRLIQSVMASDEAAANMGAPCCDTHPDYAACTHECYVPPDDVDEIERCGE
jgi:hypothetical protein